MRPSALAAASHAARMAFVARIPIFSVLFAMPGTVQRRSALSMLNCSVIYHFSVYTSVSSSAAGSTSRATVATTAILSICISVSSSAAGSTSRASVATAAIGDQLELGAQLKKACGADAFRERSA